ncbi:MULTISPECIES: PH domain-containing protein [unclassified Haladaptatus]|uniref:PH domain-containing protein n=1 Tax=unclassified Haladaptatus TaxID=2622732 RepID=UPI0023E80660|nr:MULTISPECIES: PH domain-containing protein [unclassified Haladaptatus]
MSDLDWLVPDAGEEVLWSGHPRLTTVLPAMVIGALLVGGFGAAGFAFNEPLLAIPALLGFLIAGAAYLLVVNTEFVVTNVGLYRKTGVFSRNVRRVSLSRVQNSAFSQGLLGSIFGYGSVGVEAAGGGSIRFSNIENPRDVRALVDTYAGADDIPGTLDQWQAVLEEVRGLRAAFEARS